MKNKYNQLLKSDNALIAEELFNLVPFHKLKAWQQRAVKEESIRYKEWHHCGVNAKKVYYYDLADFENLDPKNYPAEKITKEEQPDLKRVKILIKYDEMVGGFTSKYKRFEEVEKEGLDIRKKDNVITGAAGRRLDSNNKDIKYFYKGFKCKTFKEVTKRYLEDLGYKFI